jgi:DNA-binding MarR family transcriptional regulator
MQVNARTEELAELSAELVRRLRLLERREMACCGVPLSQAMVLQTLLQDGDKRMSDLAACLGVVQSTATRLVEPLERMGLIERRQACDDGRVVEAGLSTSGREVAEKVVLGSLCCSQEILDRVPKAKRAQVIDSMRVLVQALRDCCAPEPASVTRG